ncbi:SDR family NAD(P)-dependent oxidoreductase [Vibrio vulnificus]|uniref:SDR family NAD(P)-dependent oxidoreductase n=1 Tax=Vibrio vulnificus TaxID=672 RepID=UPI00092A3B66|nr:SDR family NAD(P)-dependent oxidoreductase [Vibrio vulnificus]EJT1340421.1 SDR family NAD(P)-dependent oxidoreductase [Vibrio vulnificus]ELV8745527.1 SDR family NAD(P)-dependent oxidoreductase [Vibrio vulnificus]ELV8753264.1 SDR family NAD(P)-dependent oxidoreductase [Vibrio vulnificus]MCA3902182.1 SDR family NAD(P)-dependent oxidoreductase [Vibrio vulnificus]MDS1826758.1 SDR family NAD(P)-dependent oxidoreductase [Vibrio vulnificus]
MKTAFISGSTSGIGLAFAQHLAQQGYALILHGRNQTRLNQLAETLPNVKLTIAADLSHSQPLAHLLQQLEGYPEPIEVAINNAGFGLHGEHLSLAEEAIDNMLALNISTTTKLSRYFANRMTKQGGGHMLNVASTAAYQPQPYMAAYAASKAYVSSFTESLAKEMRAQKVNITCLSPGRTNTGFFHFDGQDAAKFGQGTFAEKHRADPHTIAKLGLNALFNHQVREIPLWENKFYVFLNRLLPRNWVLSLYHRAMANI